MADLVYFIYALTSEILFFKSLNNIFYINVFEFNLDCNFFSLQKKKRTFLLRAENGEIERYTYFNRVE